MSNMLTGVRLLAVPLENDYKHTLYFEGKTSQADYFYSKTVKSVAECSYQRKDKIIRFPACVDDLWNCNYVMYRNNAHSDKWFYAFITKMEYKNDEMTEIYIQTDVIQTWLFDYQIKPSFIEREHVDDDTVGLHTVPEQLETGDYVINGKNKNASLLTHSLVLACTVDLNEPIPEGGIFNGFKFPAIAGGYYNGIYSGVKYYRVTKDECNKIIEQLQSSGQSDAIVAIFMCPSLFIDAKYPSDTKIFYQEVTESMDAVRKEWVNTLGVDETENYKPTNLDGYTDIKNNKLFTYPYCYMLMSNNSGGSAVYKYELFNNPDNSALCSFYIYSAITPGFSICITPRYYNGVEINSLERLNLGKLPVCAWSTDVYTNWLTQNAVNTTVHVGTAVASVGIGVAGALLAPSTGGLSALATVGAVAGSLGGVSSIGSTMGEVYAHSLQPPQAEGNVNSGDVTFSTKTLTFTAYQMTIKKEMAKIIDSYFTQFGYKTNRLGIPLKNHRENYWYTKTIDAKIEGALPMEDLHQIKACYNNGITFWKDPLNVGVYGLSNNCVKG